MYTLRLPFKLPRWQEIVTTGASENIDGVVYLLKKQDPFYVLQLSGFSSEAAARDYVPQIRVALLWLLLDAGLAVEADFDPQCVEYFADPDLVAENLSRTFQTAIDKPIDALLDGGLPAIYISSKRIRMITGGSGSALVTTRKADAVLKLLLEASAFKQPGKVIEDPRLLVALDLYAAHFREASANAKFLSLVMALETVATGATRAPRVLALLDKWKTEAEEILQTVDPNSDDAESLKALSRELLFRRQDSIRRQVRNVVATTLAANGDVDAAETAKRAVRIYDLRSTLVHDGRVDHKELINAISDAASIVKRVLRARFVVDAAGTSK